MYITINIVIISITSMIAALLRHELEDAQAEQHLDARADKVELWYTIEYYTILYYTILHYTILYYTIIYYTIHSLKFN